MNMTRRSALRGAAAISAGVALSSFPRLRAADAPSKKLRVAVVGLGRGFAHVTALLTLPDVEIAYLAEVDPNRLDHGMKAVTAKQQAPCQGVKDFRTFLDDKTLDAVFIATPNFWHTPAALLAMQAGKHVYVEKPGSQNPHESEMIVEASKKYKRLVQMGNQRRTWMKDAIAALHAGAIGTPKFARAFYYNMRQSVGQGALKAAPNTDLDLWQGPVPDERDMKGFRPLRLALALALGNGELGNNGIHYLDVLRWGLKVEYPERVTYTAGATGIPIRRRLPIPPPHFMIAGRRDGMGAQQLPSAPGRKALAECMFYGEGGTFAIARDSWTVYDPKGAKIGEGKGAGGGDAAHIGNFLEAIRGNAQLNSPDRRRAKEHHALSPREHRLPDDDTFVLCDPKTGKVLNSPGAEKLWKREYRQGWTPTV